MLALLGFRKQLNMFVRELEFPKSFTRIQLHCVIVGTRKCLFFGGHLTTHPRSWLISWRYLVMNRLAVLCGHDDCLARSNVWCGRNLRYQISHALRQVLWLQTRGKLTQEAIVTYLVKTVLTMTTGANIVCLLRK